MDLKLWNPQPCSSSVQTLDNKNSSIVLLLYQSPGTPSWRILLTIMKLDTSLGDLLNQQNKMQSYKIKSFESEILQLKTEKFWHTCYQTFWWSKRCWRECITQSLHTKSYQESNSKNHGPKRKNLMEDKLLITLMWK